MSTKPKNEPTPRVTRARILADAAIRGDTVAAEASGVPVATIRTWRFELAEDYELDRLYSVHLERMAAAWHPAAARTLTKAFAALEARMETGLMDEYALIAVVSKIGELMVTHGALAPERDPDAGDAGQGPGDEADTRSPATTAKH